MDMWFRESPAPLFRQDSIAGATMDQPAFDMFISLHQDNAWEVNIGMYFVHANPRKTELTAHSTQLATRSTKHTTSVNAAEHIQHAVHHVLLLLIVLEHCPSC
jgi:hypothetical protein